METSTIATIILAVVIISYLTEIIPLAVTSVLSCLAMGIFGCCKMSTVFSGLSNNVTLMILGMCIVGDSLFYTGAATYLGNKLIRSFGKTERMFVFACILLSAVLSAFLSNSATVAMLLPIAASAIASSNGRLLKKNTYMPIGFAAVAGGGTTLIGSTPQIIAQGILEDAGLQGATFFEYMLTGLPKVVIMLVFFMTIGNALIKKICTFPEVPDAQPVNDPTNDRFTRKMLISLLIMLGCVVCFIFQLWTYGVVSMLGAMLCIITGCTTFNQAFKNLDWKTIILVAFALGFAACLDESGAGQVIAATFVNLIGNDVNPMLVLTVLAFLASFLGNVVSASAATPILAPMCLYIAPKLSLDPRSLIIAVVVFGSIVYTSPTSTPPNSMPLIAGYRYMDYVKIGGLLNLVSILLLIFIFPVFYPLVA
jgi:anion transporter